MDITAYPKMSWLVFAALACVFFVVSAPAFSQILKIPGNETPKTEAPEDTALTSIEIADLPAVYLTTTELIDDVEGRLFADSTLLEVIEPIQSAGVRVDTLFMRSGELLASNPTLRTLHSLQSDWQGLIGDFDEWRNSLSKRIAAIGLEVNELVRLKQTWQMTGARAGQDRLPGEVVSAIAQTIADIEATENALYERRNQLLLIQYRVVDLEARCRNSVDIASAEVERVRERLLVADAAPLWSKAAVSEADEGIGRKVLSTLTDHVRSLRAYIESNRARVGVHLAIFIVSIILIALLGRYAVDHSEGDPVMAGAAEILRQPIPAAVLISILIDTAIHTHPPSAWTLALDLLLLIPLLALLPRLAGPRLPPAIYIIAAVYLLDSTFDVLPQHSFTGRLLKLGIKITLIITAIWLMRGLYLAKGQAPGNRRKLATLALGVVTGLLVASAVAGVIGNVSLGTVLFEGTVGSVYLGILVWLGVVVLRNIVTVILKTGVIRSTNLVRKHGEGLRLGILTIFNIAGMFVWFVITLDGFKVLDPIYDGIKRALASSFRVGDLEIATGDIVLFIFIIWLSFLISRFLRAILREEVYPRVRLAHGVPMAVDKLAHYVILLTGFFFALGAAGIDLNRFTLLAGALGVGIGFGLQNIVSNLVSGIIVLFERPVQTGDKVKIGTIEGEIKRIGLRATVVRTWEGSEVMVPNSRLVLDEVTNWTLSDQLRRMEIQVGVAYGSDTEKVSELLLKVAKDHRHVLDYPESYVLFTNFGDSSLQFSLRAWVGRFGDYLRVRSDLTAAVNKTLAEAGITIPFPQRDVHVNPGESATGETT